MSKCDISLSSHSPVINPPPPPPVSCHFGLPQINKVKVIKWIGVCSASASCVIFFVVFFVCIEMYNMGLVAYGNVWFAWLIYLDEINTIQINNNKQLYFQTSWYVQDSIGSSNYIIHKTASCWDWTGLCKASSTFKSAQCIK